MYADHRGRSPRGDRNHNHAAHREREREREDGYSLNERPYHEGCNRSRHEYSRSPAAPAGGRNELNYDDVPDEDNPSRRRGYGGEEEHTGGNGRRRDYDDRSPGYDEYSREDHRYGRRYEDYDDSRWGGRRRRSASHSDGDRDGRCRSYSPGEYRHPGQATDTVLLEGLPTDIPANELHSTLLNSEVLASLELVEIRVPQSGGNRRAFLQFRNVEEAADFVDRNFPDLHMDLGNRSERLYLHFARPREDDRRGPASDQWPCPSCDFSNFSSRTRCKNCGYVQGSSTSYRPQLTGETDASNDVSHFIVIYPLDAQVTEEILEYGIKKLEIVEKPQPRGSESTLRPLKSTAPTGDTTGYGARRGSLHRVFLMRDRASGQSLKYGFAEFWTLEDAMAALTKFRMSKNFTIGGNPVTVSGIHMGVFVPEHKEPTAATEKFSFVPLFNPALRVKYWDPHVYPNLRIINAEPPAAPEAETSQQKTEERKSKKRKADSALGSVPKKPVAMAPQIAMWQKKHHEIHGDKAPRGNESENHSDVERTSNPGKPEKQGPIKIALGGIAAKVAATVPPPSTSTKSTPPAEGQATPATPAPVSYVDRERVCCYICMMKYKSLDDLAIHERSTNHKKAMADDEKVKTALRRLEKAKSVTASSALQYRDRARERRDAFNQPNRPSSQASNSSPRPKAESTIKEKPDQQQPKESKGSAMLAKMGWTTGKGLGANGEGRTDIVETRAYQEGVGLGVEGGDLGDAAKVAERRTRGDYQGYVNEAQEKARERYNQMS